MIKRIAIAALLAGVTIIPALAQTPEPSMNEPAKPVVPVAPKLPPVSSQPQTSSANFGDWTLRCNHAVADTKSCEVATTVRFEDPRKTPIAELVFGRISKAEAGVHATAHLPPSIVIPSVVKFRTSDKDPKAIEIPYRRCLPIGCYADVVITDAQLKSLHNLGDNAGTLEFVDGGNNPIKFTIGFRGLAQALDAMAKEF
jgi:invasion protein IalB